MSYLFRREAEGEPTAWRPPITKVQLAVAFALGVLGAFLTNEAQAIARVVTAPPGTPFVRGDRRLELVAALEALDDAVEVDELLEELDDVGGVGFGVGCPAVEPCDWHVVLPAAEAHHAGEVRARHLEESHPAPDDDGMPKAQVTGGLSGTSGGSIERPFA